MLTEALAALASTGGTALVTAMVTDSWEDVKGKFARLLSRGKAQEAEAVVARLEQSRAALAGLSGADLERARAEQEVVWRTRIGDLLEQDPPAEQELRRLVAEVQEQAAYDQARALLGHVLQHLRFGDQRHDEQQPRGPSDVGERTVEQTSEVAVEETYSTDGDGDKTQSQAPREAQEVVERKAGESARKDARERQQVTAYDHLVRRAFEELVQPGRLLFNPPDRMQLGQTERVEVRLTRTLQLDKKLLRELRGGGEPQIEEIPTAPLMAVALKGDGFQITAYSDEEQRVTQDGITTWEYDIRGTKRGQQRLIVCVSLRIPVPGQPSEHLSIPVREVTVDVQVGAPALIGQFVVGNWQWFVGTAIAIAAVVVAVVYH